MMKFTLRNINGLLICFLLLMAPDLSGQVPVWEWVRTLTTEQDEYGNDVAVDPRSGDIYVVGDFWGGISIAVPSEISASTDLANVYGGTDGIVLKYNSEGKILWGFKIGGLHDDHIEAVNVDLEGNIYITGYVSTDTIVFSGINSLTTDTSYVNFSGSDYFLAKYNPDGALLWYRHSEGDADATGTGIAVSESAVYVTGSLQGKTDLGFTDSYIANVGFDAFIMKYNRDGTEEWYVTAASNGQDIASGLAIDESNIYVIGIFSGDTLFIRDPEGNDVAEAVNSFIPYLGVFYLSLTLDGKSNWSEKITSAGMDYGYGISVEGVNLYLCGSYGNVVDFPGYANNPVLHSSGEDAFVSAVSTLDGQTKWVMTLPGSSGGEQVATDISIDKFGTVYASGNFQTNIVLPDSIIDARFGGQDAFLISLSGSGDYNWIKTPGGPGPDFGKALDISPEGEIYLAGDYNASAEFDTILTLSGTGQNIFVAKMNIPCDDAVGGTLSSNNLPVCQGDMVTLDLINYYGEITWESSPPGLNDWIPLSLPGNPTVTVEAEFSLDYRAMLSVPGCTDAYSNVVHIEVIEPPFAEISGDTNICKGEEATMHIKFEGFEPWKFEYTDGTDTFGITSIATPLFDFPVYPDSATKYWLTYLTDGSGCPGNLSGVAVVEVDTIVPSDPGQGGEVCGLSFQLHANLGSTGVGTWWLIDDFGNATFNPDASDPNAVMTVTDYGYYNLGWQVENGACIDNAEISVGFIETPVAEAGQDVTIQSGESIQLFGSGGENATWEPALWINDIAVYDPIVNPPETTTYYLTVYTANSCSDTDSIVVNVRPPSFADAGEDVYICPRDSTILQASGGVSYSWHPAEGLSDPEIPDPVAKPIHTTDYIVKVTNTDGITDTDTVTVFVRIPPDIYAGEDITICLGEIVKLSAVGDGRIRWFPAELLSDSLNPEPEALLIETVEFRARIIDDFGCVNFDKLFVNVVPPPVAYAGDDQYITLITETYLRAELGEGETGYWMVESGTGIIEDSSSARTKVTNLAIGEDGAYGENSFYWTVANRVCPEVRDKVFVKVNDLVVPSVITPNGDGRNDFFYLQRVYNYNPVEIAIMDRWGTLQYSSDNYQNDWDGKDNNGTELPEETYYYVIRIFDDVYKKGYVVIIR